MVETSRQLSPHRLTLVGLVLDPPAYEGFLFGKLKMEIATIDSTVESTGIDSGFNFGIGYVNNSWTVVERDADTLLAFAKWILAANSTKAVDK